MKRGALLLPALPLLVPLAGCGSSKPASPPPPTTPTTITKKKREGGKQPRILRFDGPSSVACGKKGQIRTVGFAYRTKNAGAVEPEIDGRAIGAQAGYHPKQGTMRFPFKCPGPHTLTITATNLHGGSAARSARVNGR